MSPLELPTARERTISVTGTGRVAVRPDLVDLRMGVTITEPTVEAARAASAATLTAIIARLRALDIADRDLQTSIVSVSPAYDYSSNTNPPRLTGYTLTNLVSVTIRDIDRVGEAIDAALGAGATSVDQLSFRVEDQSAAEAQALEAAMADSRAKAETLASAAGVSIAGIAAISESGVAIPYPTPYAEKAMMAARDASTPIEAGMNECRRPSR